MSKELDKRIDTMIEVCEETGRNKGYIEVLKDCKQALAQLDEIIEMINNVEDSLGIYKNVKREEAYYKIKQIIRSVKSE